MKYVNQPKDAKSAIDCYCRDVTEIKYLTIDEICGLLRVTRATILRLVRTGELPAIQVGKQYRVAESDFESYLARSAAKATA